ncbi:MAG: hypothetical protein E5Y01_03165 [Mesorhizobium sp.]|uniref:hypothetical protein n=1 Tax=Mesorhizobium sp. TaxID=1871066 RepID=UPI0011F8E6F7|nr:hypothetical protein [Mesorhizobium sp.]TJV53328.1 MAG: hypothetical protein E5Y01_03165 [Mesorhizobium sp.]
MTDNPDDLFDILHSRLLSKVKELSESEHEPDNDDVAKLAQLEGAIQAVERAIKALIPFRS